MLKTDKRIIELVVVSQKGKWEKITRIVGDPIVKTNKDYRDADDIYDTDKSAVGYMSPGSQSGDMSFESMEDVSEEDIKKLKDEILGK